MADNKTAIGIDAFSDINEQKDPVQKGLEALGVIPKEKPQAKGAAAGCKPGSSRKSYVLPLDMIDKIGAIAAHTRRKEVAVVLDLLERGIASCEQQYGKDITSVTKFDLT